MNPHDINSHEWQEITGICVGVPTTGLTRVTYGKPKPDARFEVSNDHLHLVIPGMQVTLSNTGYSAANGTYDVLSVEGNTVNLKKIT